MTAAPPPPAMLERWRADARRTVTDMQATPLARLLAWAFLKKWGASNK